MIPSLELIDFRNHEKLTVEFAPVTVITGPNGSGKTAVLEAVSLLSVASSWKTERDSEVVRWDQPFCRLVGGEREVVIQRSPAYKRYRIDGLSKKLTDVLGTLPTVLFQPDDNALVHGAPAYRRRTLDRLISQTVPGYARALTTLQKILKQRNRLLKQIQEGQASTDELIYWDEELATVGKIIYDARKEAITTLTPLVVTSFRELMPDGEEISLKYDCSPDEGGENFVAHLERNRTKEIMAGTTLYGPHREDLIFKYGGHNADECLSRGQARALVLALKIAEVTYVEQQTEIAPILLLDDVFAEFDAERRERIVATLGRYQSILTTTDMMGVEGHLPKGAKEITFKG